MSDVNYFAVSWGELHRDVRDLVKKLLKSGKKYKKIVGICRGGMIPATIMAEELNVRDLQALCCSSYEGMNRGDVKMIGDIDIKDSEDVLIVDDLVDSGKTAEFVKKAYPKATLAVIYAKPNGKSKADVYCRDVPQDNWVVFPWEGEMRPVEPLVETFKG
ncbi:MAG: xanthine phosphoribosyltransferase [Alphaproteobacteria bacterium]|nr:xanthine phosphoribosyltransferase [Alphaproteobacteria bacterium]